MKTASTISRFLLGLIFTVFGLNGFLHFIPMGAPPSPLAGQFFVAVIQSHYISVVFALQLICGLLLLVNQFVPLALTVLAGIVLNILLFHITMAPAGLPLAFLTAVLWILVFASVRQQFTGIFAQRASV